MTVFASVNLKRIFRILNETVEFCESSKLERHLNSSLNLEKRSRSGFMTRKNLRTGNGLENERSNSFGTINL